MFRGFAAAVGAVLILLAASSCKTAPADLALPRLKPGASPSGEAATLKGTLVRRGACLAVEGNGTTIVVWPRTAQARVAGNGSTIIVWPFRRTDPPIRNGEAVELAGIIVVTDNIAGIARIPDDPGCRGGRYLVVGEAPPAAGIVDLPRLKPGVSPPGETMTLRGPLVRSGACLALGGGSTVVVWPQAGAAEARRIGINTIVIWPLTAEARVGGGGTIIIVWPFRRTDPPLRTGEEVELSGIVMVDDISGYARLPDEPGCRTGRYLVLREARPAG